ncbi:MAG: ABC transporter ATP-binding protein [Vallitaleaceae bacterium]|nr:ABC transporter ATP-binding protein [Vallitaleaceae bacterium]
MNVIEVKNLTKTYKDFKAVDDVSFTVEEGIIFGMLGPNGAGKTTTIECAAGLKKPDSGQVRILDMDALRVGKKLYDFVGVQLQETSYQDKIKVKELCDFFASMYENSSDYEPLLARFNLTAKKNNYMTQLSGGEKQKVAIILALIANPKVVFLDELTTGLDPQARREMWAYIKELKAEGRTVFMTTHYMEEAEFLCDQICLIDVGKIVITDTVEGVIEHAKLETEVRFKAGKEAADYLRGNLSEVRAVEYTEGFVKVFSEKEDIITDIILLLNGKHIAYKQIDIHRPGLEDAFLKLTGKAWRD